MSAYRPAALLPPQPLQQHQHQQVLRVMAPGHNPMSVARPTTLPAAMAQGRNIVINQPGMRPGAPGSQITVPLTTLQGLQPGQGIPTGQAGHLLVKTDTGQYQILRVGNSTAAPGPGTITSLSTSAPLPTHPIPHSSIRPVMTVNQRPLVNSHQTSQQPPPPPSSSTPVTRAATPASAGASGMGQQMTPDTAKLKCKNFLATLLRLASEQPVNVATNVRGLIQGLIDGRVEPEVFTSQLQQELNSSPQPCLVPFLKKSLPHLQQSLRSGELTIEGVRAPMLSSSTTPPSHLGVAVRIHRPPVTAINMQQQQSRPGVMQQQARPGMTHMVMGQSMTLNHAMMRNPAPSLPGLPTTARPPGMQHLMSSTPSTAFTNSGLPKAPTIPPKMAPMHLGMGPAAAPSPIKKEKNSNSSFSAGDDDINDVAAMGGVNLAEESQRMQGATDMIGTQLRSCRDETFLQTGLLHRRIAKICRDKGLEEPSSEVIALMSHATQDRLKTLIEKLSVISEHRMDVIKLEGEQYEVMQDVRGQLKFLSDLDRLEKRRHEEAEREMLLRAAKSRTKTEDPEKEKLKAKAKELQRLEEEQLRHEKANNTALLAIGGPKKKLKLDEPFSAGGKVVGGGVVGGGAASAASAMAMRPRTKRVHMRDLMFLMEQEKELKRSPLLWKAFMN